MFVHVFVLHDDDVVHLINYYYLFDENVDYYYLFHFHPYQRHQHNMMNPMMEQIILLHSLLEKIPKWSLNKFYSILHMNFQVLHPYNIIDWTAVYNPHLSFSRDILTSLNMSVNHLKNRENDLMRKTYPDWMKMVKELKNDLMMTLCHHVDHGVVVVVDVLFVFVYV